MDSFARKAASASSSARVPLLVVSPENDEPTGALDSRSSAEIMALLNELNGAGTTIVVITHEMEVVSSICDRVAVMEQGRVIEEGPVYDVFADPQSFDIHRSPNPHLSFGIAEHFCLGVHLARLEGRVFFEELLAAFSSIELIGEPVRLRSNLNNSYKKLPVRLTP